jgi:hypothetical protein
MCKVHLLPPRGDKTACGKVALGLRATVDINQVTCVKCEKAHDEYMKAHYPETDR